ncbi:MAG: hypothetical protein AAGF93_05455 [Cyanobacteria bacterium P01_H01_bin.105]
MIVTWYDGEILPENEAETKEFEVEASSMLDAQMPVLELIADEPDARITGVISK